MKKWGTIAALVAAATFATGAIAGAGGGPGAPEGFLLGGTAQAAQDPENATNDVVKIDTSAPDSYGTISRTLNAKIADLDNELEFKAYYKDRSCGGGSPRIQLSVDLNGDGTADGNVFGYTHPPFSGCAPNTWTYEDTTDALPRWDISQIAGFTGFPDISTLCPPGGPGGGLLLPQTPVASPIPCPFETNSGYIPWDVLEAVLTTFFPNHKVCSGALVDDSSWLPGAAGVAYYDIVSLGRGTWHNSVNTSGRGFASGCNAGDCADDHVDGDHDHDHHKTKWDDSWEEQHRR